MTTIRTIHASGEREGVARHGSGKPAASDAPAGLRTISSRTLFLGEHEIGIEHQGALYRLKITRQGKLILNK